MAETTQTSAPVAVGGVGGSGTRLIAQMLDALGFYLGADRNASRDTLWFTLLFKRREVLALGDDAFRDLVQLFVAAMAGEPLTAAERARVVALAAHDRMQHPAAWLRERAQSLLAAADTPRAAAPWGWKEPNTHVLLDRLNRCLPGLRTIHVMRNGLDMAFSANQNQLALWGPHFLGREVAITPHDSLAYWCAVHRRVRDIGATMGERFLLLDYDALCRDPAPGIERLLAFLGIAAAPDLVDVLAAQVEPPATVGRYRDHDLTQFDPADLACVRDFGFATN